MPTNAPDSAAFAASQATLWSAAALYAVAAVVAVIRVGWARPLVAAAVASHLLSTTLRGILIGFLPLTNKMESFSSAALAVGLTLAVAWVPRRLYVLPALVVGGAALATAFSFGLRLTDAPPLMRTPWYPLHVPASFLAYGLWTLAACASLVWLRERSPELLTRVNDLALWGFGLWSLGMVCGGVWGVVAWGAYFMWDPKVVWSVILWFHYATFVHLRLTPSLSTRPWVRPALALVGAGFVFVAYVGTSFFFGRSSHGW